MSKNYLKILVLHVFIGILLFLYKPLGSIYFYISVFYLILKIFSAPRSKKVVEIIKACVYILAIEVLLRMTGGAIFYEINKYLVLVLSVFGLFYNGFNRKATIYIIYIILLIPSIYVSLYLLDISQNIRKAIAFNLSGPICLGVSALFCFGAKVTKKELETIVNFCLYPLVSTLFYIVFYNPNVAKAAVSTGSNFVTSGGFGPNQVSTVLGLGIFLYTVRFFYFSKLKLLKYIDLVFVLLFSFRAIVTFSRGGVFTAIAMILVFIFILFKTMDKKNKNRMLASVIVFFFIAIVTWVISTTQTNGMIEKRYSNQDAAGREKADVSTGRGDLFLAEFEEFIENPFFGVGVGRVKDLRFQKTGIHAASHNEMSRIIAEHGLLGIFAFSILLLVPLFYRLGNKSNVLFFSFYLFWLLTINHSSMRIAAPAFIYALSLIKIIDEKPSLHRQQAIQNR